MFLSGFHVHENSYPASFGLAASHAAERGPEYMASAELRGFWGNGAGRVMVSNVQSPALAEIWCRVPAAQGSANRRTAYGKNRAPPGRG